MEIQLKELKESIKDNLNELDLHLSLRVSTLLSDFKNDELSKDETADLFDILVWLILKADQEPSLVISDLMVPISAESSHILDDWTISNAAAYLRDYLKKDQILFALKDKEKDKLIQEDSDSTQTETASPCIEESTSH
jgi:hypothetical protein